MLVSQAVVLDRGDRSVCLCRSKYCIDSYIVRWQTGWIYKLSSRNQWMCMCIAPCDLTLTVRSTSIGQRMNARLWFGPLNFRRNVFSLPRDNIGNKVFWWDQGLERRLSIEKPNARYFGGLGVYELKRKHTVKIKVCNWLMMPARGS